jgi:thiol-disulfide isomerase/thioredoxin
LILLTILGLVPGTARGQGLSPDFFSLNAEWSQAIFDNATARAKAKSPAEQDAVEAEFLEQQQGFVDRCLEIAHSQPDSLQELVALKLVACRASKTPEGKQAAATLIERAATADLKVLAGSLPYPTYVLDKPIEAVGPIILERVKENPDHPQAALLLASVVCVLADRKAPEAPPEFTAAADLIVQRYADSPGITNFCFCCGQSAWGTRFESHLRTILAKNQDRGVRANASFSLASIAAAGGESRRGEAEQLFEDFLKQFDGGDARQAGVEKVLRQQAEHELAALRLIGKPAPEIDGVDLDGRGLKLSEYRGKVVLLSFWASWCRGCVAMIPEEGRLVEHWEGKPFAIVGVNGDSDLPDAKSAAQQHGVSWRSFRQGDGQTVRAWGVLGWPTFYLIDAEGIVRRRWVGEQPYESLIGSIEPLIEQKAPLTPNP